MLLSVECYCNDADPILDQFLNQPPTKVKATKHLYEELWVLTMLMELEVPPLRRRRGSSPAKVLYGIGDSTGNGAMVWLLR
jgi:hypothetical protein